MSLDFGLTQDQELFQRSVRDFMRKECPRTLVRHIEKERQDYARETYAKMAELGWLALLIPEEYGGVGGSWIDTAILYEEIGRVLLPGPHYASALVSAQIILALGSEEQKRALLPRIAAGEIVVVPSFSEPEAAFDLAAASTSATSATAGYRLTGVKLYVPYAHVADFLIVSARTGPRSAQASGVSLFIVDARPPGLTYDPIESMGGERLCAVRLEGVQISSDALLGPLDGGDKAGEVIEKCKVMRCAEMMGGSHVVLEMARQYALERVQFGQLIGAFQAIQHKLADMALALDGARWKTYYAAWALSAGLPFQKDVAAAQLEAGEAYRFITAEGMQIHGGGGAMEEHDLGLYFRRAKALQVSLGPVDAQKERIALALGL